LGPKYKSLPTPARKNRTKGGGRTPAQWFKKKSGGEKTVYVMPACATCSKVPKGQLFDVRETGRKRLPLRREEKAGKGKGKPIVISLRKKSEEENR